jgi:methylenetetrahydrofolate dehydrogenase (NADP+)/methenyltetrahydrofolate cyclohydrolase
MIIDGKKIAEAIRTELRQQLDSADRPLCLVAVVVGADPVTLKFVTQKQKIADSLGIEMRVWDFPADISQADLAEAVEKLANDRNVQGIIVQLPLPSQIKTSQILNLIPSQKDVDALSENASLDSPIVRAVLAILDQAEINLTQQKILVIGQGQLVGRPITIRLAQAGLDVEVADGKTPNLSDLTLAADVIISGVGKPGLIKPDMIKNGVTIVDCGTSEQSGQLAGDASPDCALKCAFFTPVPGGVGPVMVAMLFKNLVDLTA